MKQLLTIAFMLGCLTIMAQQKDRLEKFKALKVAFITEKLDLSSKEAQNFWPIYNEYNDNSEVIRQEQRLEFRQNIKRGEKMSDLDNRVSQKLIASYLSTEEGHLELKKKLVSDLKSVISSKKIWKLIRAEEEFKQKMISEFKKRKHRSPEKRENRK